MTVQRWLALPGRPTIMVLHLDVLRIIRALKQVNEEGLEEDRYVKKKKGE